MIVLGLMSGTSMDGVDAVVTNILRRKGRLSINLLGQSKVGYAKRVRRRLEAVCHPNGNTSEVCSLNIEIGKVFAKAAKKAIDTYGLDVKKLLIGSHGQTVYHMPGKGATLAIGDPSVIAHETGAVVWSGFRSADMARGGQGAPLAPLAHLPLFSDKRKYITAINVGGMANLTHIPMGATDLSEVVAFDAGPGVRLVDMAVSAMGLGDYDQNGKIAKSGYINLKLLAKMSRHPYFRRKPPKSTGREIFNESFFSQYGIDIHKEDKDIIATLTELTAVIITKEIVKLSKSGRPTDRIVLCGGGAKNGYLVDQLNYLSDNRYDVVVSDDLGYPCDAVEGALMALMAWHSEKGEDIDISNITGAKGGALIHGQRYYA